MKHSAKVLMGVLVVVGSLLSGATPASATVSNPFRFADGALVTPLKSFGWGASATPGPCPAASLPATSMTIDVHPDGTR